MKKKFYLTFLSVFAVLANVTAQLGAGTASSWGCFQAEVPAELKR